MVVAAVADGEDHVRRPDPSHLVDAGQADMPEETGEGFMSGGTGFEFRPDAQALVVAQAYDRQAVRGRGLAQILVTLLNQIGHLLDLAGGGLHDPADHRGQAGSVHIMVDDLAAGVFHGQGGNGVPIAVVAQEGFQTDITGVAAIMAANRRQKVNELAQRGAGDGLLVGQDDHGVDPGQDAQQLQGMQVGGSVDDADVSQRHQRRGRSQGGGSGHHDRLGGADDISIFALQPLHADRVLAGEQSMQLVRLGSPGIKDLGQTSHHLLGDHGPNTADMLRVDLDETLGDGGQGRPILVGDDGGRFHDVLEDRGPPGKQKLGGGGVFIQLAGAEIIDQLAQPQVGAFLQQVSPFRQGVKSPVIIE